jgi:hypothetical protein
MLEAIMQVKRAGWSVIIVGRWNKAILTPAGICERVFGLDTPSELEVAVPLDGVSPYRVRHPDHRLVVMVDENRLRLELQKTDYETLAYAMERGVFVMKKLPETPFAAAGFNVDFGSSEVGAESGKIVAANVDAVLAGLARDVESRRVTRSLVFKEGRLNLMMAVEGEQFSLSCNFHRGSGKSAELQEWLQTPASEVEQTVSQVLAALGLEEEEVPNADDAE